MGFKFLEINIFQGVSDGAEIVNSPNTCFVDVLDYWISQRIFIIPFFRIIVQIGSVGRIGLSFNFIFICIEGINLNS